jgi:hypothetical protein
MRAHRASPHDSKNDQPRLIETSYFVRLLVSAHTHIIDATVPFASLPRQLSLGSEEIQDAERVNCWQAKRVSSCSCVCNTKVR